MFKIERALTTLLGQYKLFSQGNLPHMVNETVQPTMDLTNASLAACGIQVLSFSGAPGVGIVGTYTQTEDWLVIGSDLIVVSAATNEQFTGYIQFAPQGPGSEFRLAQTPWSGSSVGNSNSAGAGWIRPVTPPPLYGPLYTPKQTVWTISVGAEVGAPTSITAQILHYKLGVSGLI